MPTIKSYLFPLLLAPWVVVPISTLSFLGTSDAGLVSDFGWGLFLSVLMGLPIAYLCLFVVGVPVFLLLRKFNSANWFTVAAAGFLIPSPILFDGTKLHYGLLFCFCGLAVALSAFAILIRAESKR